MVWLQHCSGWSPHTFPPRWRQYPSSAIVCSVFPSRTCIHSKQWLFLCAVPLYFMDVFLCWLTSLCKFFEKLVGINPTDLWFSIGLSLSLILSTPISKPLFIICVAVHHIPIYCAHNNKTWDGLVHSIHVFARSWKAVGNSWNAVVWV